MGGWWGGLSRGPQGRGTEDSVGPWSMPGTSACGSQSAGTREEGRERVTRDTDGDTGDGRRDQNVIIRCLENKKLLS